MQDWSQGGGWADLDAPCSVFYRHVFNLYGDVIQWRHEGRKNVQVRNVGCQIKIFIVRYSLGLSYIRNR